MRNVKPIFGKIEPITETLYNSQVGAVLFMCAMVYKISSLPGLIYKDMHSSTLWLFLFMTAIDLVAFFFMYAFFKHGADNSLRDSRAYKAGLLLLAAYLSLKLICFFYYGVIYLSVELFSGIESVVVILVLLLPVTYFGVKGVRSIARACEMTVFISLGILLINLIFIKTEMDVGRNLPIFAIEPVDFFTSSFGYGLWLGDLFPLIFIGVRNKRLPYTGFSAFLTSVLICLITFLGVAMYGEALPLVESVAIRTAGFNQLSLEIGRMEWTVLFVVMIMAVFELALLFWGITECAARITHRKLPVQILLPIIIIVVGVTVPALNDIIEFSKTKILGYVFCVMTLFLPLYFNLLRKTRDLSLFNYGEFKRITAEANA